MIAKVLVDTGPLVAFLNLRDRYHAWALQELAELRPPLLTCEAVLSEACFLLRHLPGGSQAVMELVSRSLVMPSFRLEEEVRPVAALLTKYKSVPISFADACLVRMSEIHSGSLILTLDRGFRIFRRHGRQVIPTRMPKD
jgi:predicted nucleic acid-binding protein